LGYVTIHVTKGNAANTGDVFLMNLAPHTGHSSQLLVGDHRCWIGSQVLAGKEPHRRRFL